MNCRFLPGAPTAVLIAAIVMPGHNAQAQTFEAEPYIQHLTPSQVWVLWESVSAAGGTVAFGVDRTDEHQATGQPIDGQISEAQLTGLTPATRYRYRVTTADGSSGEYTFTTPSQDREAALRMVAISDAQRDGGNPDKLDEIIHDGILELFSPGDHEAIDGALDLVLSAGDMVDSGWDQDRWRDEWLAPIHDLSARVPFYPVLGNHEANADYFFHYQHLPDDGPDGWIEHCYTVDRGNVRIIGLDSNTIYASQTQLDWLSNVLDDACADDDLDFVVAQLHHPYLSELWPPGEVDFTGEVIALMDQFATTCSKPAVHLFGHTHGYSRGQSRDHSHLWVNVASAGGNLDYWGEYDQIDYPEFTVSQDEYGFVVLDATAGDDPTLHVRRFGRGDEETGADNELRDEVTIRRHDRPPETPMGTAPTSAQEVAPDCVVLVVSSWCHPDGDEPGATQWQVAGTCEGFDEPIEDRWIQHENWFADVDTQAGDHLGDEVIEALDPDRSYCWRARRRGKGLTWSAWSDPVEFRTGDSALTDNLLVNPGAESGTDGWTVVQGALESLGDGECDGTTPYAGQRYFGIGGVCDGHEVGEARQRVDVSTHAEAIDGGAVVARYGGWLSDWDGHDLPELQVVFLDGADVSLAQTERFGSLDSTWIRVLVHTAVPVGTRTIEFVMFGTRTHGTDNDSYVDELQLRLATDGALDVCLATPPYPHDDTHSDCDPVGDDDGEDDDDSWADPDEGGGCDGCAMADAGVAGPVLGGLGLAAAALRRRHRRRLDATPGRPR